MDVIHILGKLINLIQNPSHYHPGIGFIIIIRRNKSIIRWARVGILTVITRAAFEIKQQCIVGNFYNIKPNYPPHCTQKGSSKIRHVWKTAV